MPLHCTWVLSNAALQSHKGLNCPYPVFVLGACEGFQQKLSKEIKHNVSPNFRSSDFTSVIIDLLKTTLRNGRIINCEYQNICLEVNIAGKKKLLTLYNWLLVSRRTRSETTSHMFHGVNISSQEKCPGRLHWGLEKQHSSIKLVVLETQLNWWNKKYK